MSEPSNPIERSKTPRNIITVHEEVLFDQRLQRKIKQREFGTEETLERRPGYVVLKWVRIFTTVVYIVLVPAFQTYSWCIDYYSEHSSEHLPGEHPLYYDCA